MKKIISLFAAVLFAGSMMAVQYELVTSTGDLTAGTKYLIGNGTDGDVSFVSTANKANNRELTNGTVTSSKVTKTNEMMALTLGGSTGAWTFATNDYLGTAGYLNATSTTSNNYLKIVAALDDYAYFSISFSESAAVITCTGKTERHIMRNNGTLISCYSSGYDPVYLYKEIVSSDPSISITGSGAFGTVDKDDDASKEFTLSGANLQEGTLNISVTGGYTVSPTSISVNNLGELASNTVTVSKNSTTIGPNDGTLKVYGAGVTEGNASTVSLTMTIGDKFTVSFSTGTSNPAVDPIEEASVGAGITLPAGPTPVATGWSFAGWAASAVASKTSVMPSLLTAGSKYEPTEDVTLYAVYKKTEGASPSSGTVTITPDTENFPTSYGTANAFTQYTLEGYTFKIQQICINSGKLQWRAKGHDNGTGTIYNTQTFPEKISSIVLTYNGDSNKNHTLKVGSTENPTEGTNIEGTTVGDVKTFDCSTANADYFVMENGTGAGYTASLVINYGDMGTIYYHSSPSDIPTAIDETEAANQATKELREGQVLIIKGDKTYNILGQEIK